MQSSLIDKDNPVQKLTIGFVVTDGVGVRVRLTVWGLGVRVRVSVHVKTLTLTPNPTKVSVFMIGYGPTMSNTSI